MHRPQRRCYWLREHEAAFLCPEFCHLNMTLQAPVVAKCWVTWLCFWAVAFSGVVFLKLISSWDLYHGSKGHCSSSPL